MNLFYEFMIIKWLKMIQGYLNGHLGKDFSSRKHTKCPVIRPRPRAELFFPSGITEPVKRNRANRTVESVSKMKNLSNKVEDIENNHEKL